MIFECGPKGADWQVCEFLVRKLDPNIEIHQPPTTLSSKPKLIQDCGKSAKILLKQGCERVIIIWDLYPAWRENKEKPCLKQDREKIYQSLDEAGVAREKIDLVCIQEELEAWLIADHRPLKEFLEEKTHPHPLNIRLKSKKHPDRVNNPKGKLTDIFKQATGQKYKDHIDAIKIIQKLSDFQKLKNSLTFKRFVLKTTGQILP
ncbi:DUF4276 family protein [[Leptolyngbya] sp. PCC 7376]|uniref:DUF4276 family protein n=1 Tax=[Leptolyngbya] sp. PCC 7376 TaxID=111781 RepID=UPI0009FCBA69|nr:DUF4276 family protein [[Leptolyngbya] sp. PCC 7376]